MEELIYTDRNGNEFMVNMNGKKVSGIYTYADTAYNDSVLNVDSWKPYNNRVFVHCPNDDVAKAFKILQTKAILN